MESHTKSLLKAVSWRIFGSLGTFLIAWWFTGNVLAGASISAAEFVIKIGMFYAHERMWSRVK